MRASLHGTWRGLGSGSLALLAAVLPFELVKPVAPLGPLKLSSVELFLYASVGLWMVAWWAAGPGAGAGGLAARLRPSLAGWRRLPEAHRAAAAWSLVLLVAAALAPLQRAAAVKFALRSLGGVALFLATADLLDSRRAVRRTALGLGVGAVISALLMALEVAVPGFAQVLRPFHGQTFGVLGLARASGPFQYPNIAAMFLEAAAPVILAAGVVGAGARHLRPGQVPRMLGATALAALAIIYALVLTASRAGLVAELVVLIGIAVLADQLPVLRRLSIGLAVGTLVITVVAQAVSPMLALRLRFWQERSWYGSAIEATSDAADAVPAQMAPGSEIVVGLSIRNLGAIVWPKDGKKPVLVSYHWTSEDGNTVYVLDGARTPLPYDVPPDEKVDVAATVRAPDRIGRYQLWWDLVHEGVTWFSDAGDPGWRVRVAVGVAASRRKAGLRGARTLSSRSAFDQFSRRDLWHAGLLAFWDHPLFGLGPDNFRHAYGRYLGRLETDERLHANNFYVEILATLGLAGLLALATLIATLARTARRAAAWPETRVLTLGTGAALAAYLVHGTLDYFLEFTPTYALFWLLAGMLVALERIAARERAGR